METREVADGEHWSVQGRRVKQSNSWTALSGAIPGNTFLLTSIKTFAQYS